MKPRASRPHGRKGEQELGLELGSAAGRYGSCESAGSAAALEEQIAVQPHYANLIPLARLGKRGRLDEGLVVSGYLWEHRADAGNPEQARQAVSDYLITLGRAAEEAERLNRPCARG